MPAKRKLPRNARRLPKGTSRDDYDPEVLREFDRSRWRHYKELHRKKLNHHGRREVTFALGKDARDTLARLQKDRGMSKSDIITHLLENADVIL